MIPAKKLIISLAACSALTAAAQEAPRTAYFLDGHSYRHELNPAFAGERSYVSLPVLANFNVGLLSNIGVNSFLYKTPPGSQYKLTTFMSPTVDAATFLDNLNENNHINANFDLTLLSAGFKAFNGYNTITVGVKADMGVNLPKDLFAFMKLGQTGPDTKYHFDDIKAQASAVAEIALGHSHKINDKLNVGAKAKVLLGLSNATAHIKNMDVAFGHDKWQVTADGEMQLSAGSGLRVPTKAEAGKEYTNPGDADLIEWGDIDYDKFGLSGFGLGFDLGATYKLLPDLELSAAITDLGFMNWNNAVTGKTGTGTWSFDGFQNIAIDNSQPGYEENKIDEQFDRLWDDMQDVINIHRENNGSGSYTKALHATLRLGAEYQMPFYDRLTGGFLFSSQFAGIASWTEGRFYATVKPVKWFDATVNYGASTYGSSFGWMINFHPKGFNFFVGSDHQFFRVTPQYVPVGNATANINFGFNVTFGS